MTDYKKYSLGQVENFLYDAMSTDATPQEIYDVIKGVVQDNYYTYKNSTEKAYELLALLNGNGVGHVGVDLNYPKVKLAVPLTICDKDDTSEECKKSWNDFWVEDLHRNDYTDEELNAMCAAAEEEELISKGYFKENGFWQKPKDKAKKWILPVEEVKDADTDETEYFVSFPQDLLEAANLNEGDSLEWIDQGDGSYLMKKVEKKEHPSWVKGNELAKVKTYQEMIDDGWSMTDDGFWIKEI
jgi:bifunctional DNA-binding transcriptional regulator/antitoxin component of YhaV-PrlF toxin-antitoxin module